MAQPVVREVEHDIKVDAPAGMIYRLIADVTSWPEIFPPSIHVEYLERGESQERIQIWATASAEARTWTSRRLLDRASWRVQFRQEVPSPPVSAMGGVWVVEPISERESVVRLYHDYRAVDDDPEQLSWIERAVDHNSRAELAALKASAEAASAGPDSRLTFADTVQMAGATADAYAFIYEAQRWQERLPQVARVSLREDTPGLQLLEMDTRAGDGSRHTTTSVRVCFPHSRIAYKQIQLPALLSLHTGCWLFEESPGGVTVTSRHTVRVKEDKVAEVLGDGASVEDARTYVRQALSANSRKTLAHAKEYAERRV